MGREYPSVAVAVAKPDARLNRADDATSYTDLSQRASRERRDVAHRDGVRVGHELTRG
jgi:hypothetical protein